MLVTAPNLLRQGRCHGFLENVVTHPDFREWSRERCGQCRAGASLAPRLPSRAAAKRSHRSSGTQILRAPGLRSRPQDCIRRLENLSEAEQPSVCHPGVSSCDGDCCWPFAALEFLMAQSVPNPPPGFDELSLDEKIDYVESLWDQVVEHSSIPIPEWHRELLQERLEAFRDDPAAGRTWDEVRADLQRKYQPSRSR